MKRFHLFITATVFMCIATMLGACTMLEEDRSDCPSGLYVNFVYDYNIQRADMFKDHVGYVTVYVYDENGKKVAEKSIGNVNGYTPLNDYGYPMHFSEQELPTNHQYRLQAVAMQKDWDDALHSRGAKYRRSTVNHQYDLTIALDHDATPIPGTSVVGPHAVSDAAPLDTLWQTLKVLPQEPYYGYEEKAPLKTTAPYSIYPLEDQMVTLKEGYATYATISLIRDTKHLNLTIHQIDEPADIYASDFEVTIVDDNATLSFDNSVIPSDSLQYTPYATWTTTFGENGLGIEYGPRPKAVDNTDVISRAAHYDLMFNRLMFNSNSEKSAKLCIRNRNTGNIVGYFNLPYMLAEGRTAWELYHYTPQEYLDREYNYKLELFLMEGKWKYMDIHIDVLSWTRRLQNTEL